MDGFERAHRAAAPEATEDSDLKLPVAANEQHIERLVSYHSGLPLRFLGMRPHLPKPGPQRRVRLLAKRAIDIVASAAALVVMAPLFVCVAIAIRLESRGPILFKQAREGLNGDLFPAFKFRSMRSEDCDASGVAFTVARDKRITRVGRLLRRTSIDELPQLANVLLGHMSLVGPRPHVPGMIAGGRPYRELVAYYDDRLGMLPGITGWAQANGYRGEVSDPGLAKARVDHDIAYIQNFSLLLDVKIILTTLRREFIGGNGR